MKEKNKKGFYIALGILFLFLIILSIYLHFSLDFKVGDIVLNTQDNRIGYVDAVNLLRNSYVVDFSGQLEEIESFSLKLISEARGEKINFSDKKEVKLDFVALTPEESFQDINFDSYTFDNDERSSGRAVFFGGGAIGFDQSSINGCNLGITCGDWSQCEPNYNINDLTLEDSIKGIKRRICIDSTGCIPDFLEFRDCELKEEITVKKIYWCGKEYIEIESINQEEVSKIEQVAEDYLIVHLYNEGEFCYYCSNNIKDYDEEGVDCGGSCRACG